MDSRLVKSIKDYGGKFGPLLHIRDHEKDGQQLVPPLEVFSMDDFLNGDLGPINSIKRACGELGVEHAILRSGMKGYGDFRGLVDVFPTEPVIPLDKLNVDYLRRVLLPKMLDVLENPLFPIYVESEGFNFDIKNVVFGLMPQFYDYATTVTEHPNQPEKVMVDIRREFGDKTRFKYGVYDAMDFVADSPTWTRKAHLTLVPDRLFWNANELRHTIHEMGILDPIADAYQFEMIPDNSDNQQILQIRFFARRRLADFEVERNTVDDLTDRIFGITGKEGIVLPWLNAERREEAEYFESENPGVPYILGLDRDETTRPLELWHKFPQLWGYSVTKRFLAHQNTRLVQDALRKQEGFAVLRHVHEESFRTGAMVRVVCDGGSVLMEEV